MNPSAPVAEIERAYEEDFERAHSEFGANFRRDMAPYVDREPLEACVVIGRFELPPVSGTNYVAFVDVSAGARDSYAVCICSLDDDGRAIVALIREWRAPFDPEVVTDECCALLRLYGIDRVEGDAFAGEWPREQFRKRGVVYDVSKRAKSALYVDFLPAINSGKVELPDSSIAVNQFAALERRTARSGRDVVDHPPGGRDDVANAVAGACLLAFDRAAPALWSAGTSLPEWKPERCTLLVSFVAVDRDGALLVLHCLGKPHGYPNPLCIFAAASALPASEISRIRGIQWDVLGRYVVSCPEETQVYFLDEILLPPARAAGLPARHVSSQIPPAMVADHRALALAAAALVGSGAVAVAPEFVENARVLPLGSVLSCGCAPSPIQRRSPRSWRSA